LPLAQILLVKEPLSIEERFHGNPTLATLSLVGYLKVVSIHMLIERLNKEFKRRTKSTEILAGEAKKGMEWL